MSTGREQHLLASIHRLKCTVSSGRLSDPLDYAIYYSTTCELYDELIALIKSKHARSSGVAYVSDYRPTTSSNPATSSPATNEPDDDPLGLVHLYSS